jgi:hypothetical protein
VTRPRPARGGSIYIPLSRREKQLIAGTAKPRRRAPRSYFAKYDGECFDCGRPIKKGQQIRYDGKAHCAGMFGDYHTT